MSNAHMVIVTKYDEHQVTTNFKSAEFFSKDPTFTGKEHNFDSRLFEASQIVRDYCNSPTQVTSTYRGPLNPHTIAKPNSYHPKSMAVDLMPSNWSHMVGIFRSDVELREGVFLQLWQKGVRGIGLYDWGIHLDTRPTGGKQSYMNSSFAFWDASTITAPHPFDGDTMSDALTNTEEIAFNPVYIPIAILFLIIYSTFKN